MLGTCQFKKWSRLQREYEPMTSQPISSSKGPLYRLQNASKQSPSEPLIRAQNWVAILRLVNDLWRPYI